MTPIRMRPVRLPSSAHRPARVTRTRTGRQMPLLYIPPELARRFCACGVLSAALFETASSRNHGAALVSLKLFVVTVRISSLESGRKCKDRLVLIFITQRPLYFRPSRVVYGYTYCNTICSKGGGVPQNSCGRIG